MARDNVIDIKDYIDVRGVDIRETIENNLREQAPDFVPDDAIKLFADKLGTELAEAAEFRKLDVSLPEGLTDEQRAAFEASVRDAVSRTLNWYVHSLVGTMIVLLIELHAPTDP